MILGLLMSEIPRERNDRTYSLFFQHHDRAKNRKVGH